MIDYQKYFNWPEVQIEHFYVYLILAFLAAGYLVIKSNVKYKFELFFIVFYLLSGNINKILTFKIPGLGFFEVQPIRFLFLLLGFFIVRKVFFSRERLYLGMGKKAPLFIFALLFYVFWSILSVLINSPEMEFTDVLDNIHDALAFLVLLTSISIIRDKSSYDLIGKTIIIAAAVSSLVSLIQLFIDPYFLRIGEDRIAFADVIRSNGIFTTEYFNSYFLIIAMSWALVTIKNDFTKFLLTALFTLGVISSFQRMSWIILAVVIITYMLFIRRIRLEKLAFIGLSGLALILAVSIFYYQDIMRSSLVQERLADTIGGRAGYYELVIDNIDKSPIFGFGDLTNDIYYENMLRITNSRERASAESGDLHSGYFSAMYLYGVPAFISFTFFVVFVVVYYARRYKEDYYYVIPFLVGIIYLISNLTNTFLFIKYISILLAIHLGISLGIQHLSEKEA